MNEILEKNLACIQKRMPQLYKECRKKYIQQQETQEENVFLDDSVRGEKIIGVIRNGRAWYLNSRYDAQAAVEIWSEQCRQIHYKSIILMCGLSNGMYLRALQKKTGEENRVIVYEPDMRVFLYLIAHLDLTDELKDERTIFFVEGLNMNCFREYFREIYECELVNLSVTLVSPAYGTLYAQQLENLIADCEKEIRLIFGAKTTLENIGEEICDNIISNMWCLFKGTSINAIKAHLEEQRINLQDIPAILISAGPSLDKNIDRLPGAKGRALLVAVDSAVRKLLLHNIIPDIIVTVDSHKPLTLFEDPRTKAIPLVVCGQSRHEILKKHEDKLFVFSGDMFLLKLFTFMNRAVQGLQTGGSVANDAFSFVEFLGFRKIILVGQDLAFTDDKKHADDVYEEKGIGENEEDEYTYVEGCNGGKLLTFSNFRIYKEWFENRIADNPELKVINATEGGARINGAIQMTLDTAINEYCTQSISSSCILHTERLFSDEELESVYEYLKAVRRRCEELQEYFEQGKSLYLQLGKIIRSGCTGGPEYERIYAGIQEISSLDKNEPLMELLTMYARREESAILENLYQEDEGVEGALSVVRHGTQILSVYQEKAKHIAEQLELLLNYEVAGDLYQVETYDISLV